MSAKTIFRKRARNTSIYRRSRGTSSATFKRTRPKRSVDRLEAGLAIGRAARALGRNVRVLVQVNVSPTERFGVAPAEAAHLAERLRAEGLTVDGVMAIGPLEGDVDDAFEAAREAFTAVGGTTLSLGMSADWERAVAFGSTMIRIGTAIFGPRPVQERVTV
jgi:PLP dependent protein